MVISSSKIVLSTFLIGFLLILGTTTSAQGTIIEGLSFKGDILDHEVQYAVYLPPGHESSQRSYPVLYLLHGYSDDETGWIQFGEVDRIVDAGIANGDITPMIIVMPDGGVTYYINNQVGDEKWSDMFIREFIPHIEDGYRVRGSKRYRAIAGLSMGGYGALIHSLKYPEMFSGCGAFSAAVRTDTQMRERYIRDDRSASELYGPMEGDALPDHWYENSVLHHASSGSVETLNSVRYWIDCGDDDFLAIGNASLHIEFEKRGVAHEYRVRDGEHNWTYWRTGLTDALRFISDGFRQK